ncbi:TlyA family RNA methyltransferase [Selenomonas caprae]|uniref:23S rRNA (Cytidine1920-2'-O)/16S rRNA (Cytidine1409-2'-O)-methyltransferase n=2 Tax=Selenomonas TaxID=970 RepID=A0A1I3D6B9_SELRU|nr:MULTISPECIES: TlyA family RNA methyltransferase [Selenomonas]MBQ1889850.1 TlyA family RNA methyltransferase [Selenomonas sp.]TYZ30202.1 TlyA family RNA methyltransferase [Selenomonas caprae]SFH82255.1 23S rRNA (cytidine1920-2'-O)/16S rRNA (cytidine1409-2'-O)-methyltransferase [Selenomonas ruminantium]
MAKQRLDVLLVERGLAGSRERAKRMIMAGEVLVDNQKVDKAGATVKPEAEIRLLGNDIPYVSRGGLKLEKAMQEFGVPIEGRSCADIGASTGGFTDCMLQNGAVRVYAIDVGYGQLAWKLRTDERVVNMERTNIRNVTPEDIGQLLDFASIDVAFISLTKVLPVAFTLLKEDGELVALIKPQFEAGREFVGKKGVVREPSVHEDVIRKVTGFARELGFVPMALTFSPVKGPEGNIEYLIRLTKDKSQQDTVTEERLAAVVAEAHGALDK